MDIMPLFWERFLEKVKVYDIRIIEEVYDEIQQQKDDLSIWLKENKKHFNVQETDREILRYYQVIINKMQNEKRIERKKMVQKYNAAALEELQEVSNADPFIVAHAMSHALSIVVTNEKYEKDIVRKVKIPNMCKKMNVRYIDFLTFLRKIDFEM